MLFDKIYDDKMVRELQQLVGVNAILSTNHSTKDSHVIRVHNRKLELVNYAIIIPYRAIICIINCGTVYFQFQVRISQEVL